MALEWTDKDRSYFARYDHSHSRDNEYQKLINDLVVSGDKPIMKLLT